MLAAVMRPTFWVLGLAWLCACAWGLIVGPRRRFYFICLCILLLVWLAFAAVDPRTRGFAPLSGGYEREAVEIERERAGVLERVQRPSAIESGLALQILVVKGHLLLE